MLRLEMLRKELELSQEEFAKKVNMTQQRISAYEKGKREPDIETIKQFSNFFEVSIDYLLGKTDIRNPEQQENSWLSEFMDKYVPPSEKQKQQIKELVEVIMKDNKKK